MDGEIEAMKAAHVAVEKWCMDTAASLDPTANELMVMLDSVPLVVAFVKQFDCVGGKIVEAVI